MILLGPTISQSVTQLGSTICQFICDPFGFGYSLVKAVILLNLTIHQSALLNLTIHQ